MNGAIDYKTGIRHGMKVISKRGKVYRVEMGLDGHWHLADATTNAPVLQTRSQEQVRAFLEDQV